MGFTLSEAYVRIEEDEIRTIWQQARVAAVGSRPCPICSTTMVKVAVAPRGSNDAALDLDVCVVDEFFWFEAGELDAIPVATPDPVPSPEEAARIVEITKEFGNELSEGWGARDNTRLRDHLINRYGNRAANT